MNTPTSTLLLNSTKSKNAQLKLHAVNFLNNEAILNYHSTDTSLISVRFLSRIINALGEILAGASVFIIPVALLFIGDYLDINHFEKQTIRQKPNTENTEIVIDHRSLNENR